MEKNLLITVLLLSVLIVFVFLVAPPDRGRDLRNYDLIDHLDDAEISQHKGTESRDLDFDAVPIKEEFFRLLQRLVAAESKISYPALPYRGQTGEKPDMLYIQYYNLIREGFTPFNVSLASAEFSLEIQISADSTRLEFTSSDHEVTNQKKISRFIETGKDDELYLVQFKGDLVVIAGKKLLLDYKLNSIENSRCRFLLSPNRDKEAGVSGSVAIIDIDQFDIKRIKGELDFVGFSSSECRPVPGMHPREGVLPVHRMEKDLSTRALLISPDYSIEYKLIVPLDSYFEYGYKFEGLTKPGNYTADIIIKNSRGEDLAERKLLTETAEWMPDKINLSEYIGQRITIGIHFKSNGNSTQGAALLVSNPVIRSRREHDEDNVLFLFLDTLRADHLGCYGYPQDTSPNIDRLANDGIVFENVFSQSNWTLPSAASFFTSLYPAEALPFLDVEGYINYDLKLNPYVLSLGEYYKQAGYKTAAFTGNGWMAYKRGFDRGFEIYEHSELVVEKEKRGLNRSVDKILPWIKDNKDQKWFLMLHTYEIHAPYVREPFYTSDSRNAAGDVIAQYDSGIRYADQQIGRIIAALKSADIYDNTIIILMSDHGERFVNQFTGKPVAEKMGLHGNTFYDSEIHVPVIIYGGSVNRYAGKRVETMAGLIDLLPTMLSLVEIKIPRYLRGIDLMEFADCDEKSDRQIFSEHYLNRNIYYAIRSDEHKLIVHSDADGKKTMEHYNIQIDPEESFNIAGNLLKTEARMKDRLQAIISALSEAKKRYIDLLLAPI